MDVEMIIGLTRAVLLSVAAVIAIPKAIDALDNDVLRQKFSLRRHRARRFG